ncbi:hypothetical protein BACCOP_03910 [Phocaeicola coprocola DSM 17136]|uniref:Uncharacterized protein n=1 Tax=Phocaeicola coprocola DSM 17136 TaxID=470145 RepID=B3JPE9_9BACT|nr:hypothetical protein BACCOP_03910 [Phocaeicola coprocola DSM 17136]
MPTKKTYLSDDDNNRLQPLRRNKDIQQISLKNTMAYEDDKP